MEPTHERFRRAIAAFDLYHQKDPHLETDNGQSVPGELLYAFRMTERLTRFAPMASEPVWLAARCQHIGRWELPRDQYPMDRKGYLQWRNEEKARHARIAAQILEECGYDPDTIAKVKQLVLKKEIRRDAEAQLLEDVACLVFVEHYLEAFAAKHHVDKVLEILRKTARKMSRRARQALSDLSLPDQIRRLVAQSLSDEATG